MDDFDDWLRRIMGRSAADLMREQMEQFEPSNMLQRELERYHERIREQLQPWRANLVPDPAKYLRIALPEFDLSSVTGSGYEELIRSQSSALEQALESAQAANLGLTLVAETERRLMAEMVTPLESTSFRSSLEELTSASQFAADAYGLHSALDVVGSQYDQLFSMMEERLRAFDLGEQPYVGEPPRRALAFKVKRARKKDIDQLATILDAFLNIVADIPPLLSVARRNPKVAVALLILWLQWQVAAQDACMAEKRVQEYAASNPVVAAEVQQDPASVALVDARSGLRLRSKPSRKAPPLLALQRGALVRVMPERKDGSSETWVKVRLLALPGNHVLDGVVEGWVAERFLLPVPLAASPTPELATDDD